MILAERPGVFAARDMTLCGRFGFVRLSPDGEVVFAKLVAGTSLTYGNLALTQSLAALTGELVSVGDSDPDAAAAPPPCSNPFLRDGSWPC